MVRLIGVTVGAASYSGGPALYDVRAGEYAMSAGCVPSLDALHRFLRRSINPVIAVSGFVLAFGAVDVTHGLKGQTAGAESARAEPVRTDLPWSLPRSATEPLICSYDNFPTCLLAGFREGGSCVSNPGPAAATASPGDSAPRRRTARSTPAQQPGARQSTASAAPSGPA